MKGKYWKVTILVLSTLEVHRSNSQRCVIFELLHHWDSSPLPPDMYKVGMWAYFCYGSQTSNIDNLRLSLYTVYTSSQLHYIVLHSDVKLGDWPNSLSKALLWVFHCMWQKTVQWKKKQISPPPKNHIVMYTFCNWKLLFEVFQTSKQKCFLLLLYL